MAREVPFVRGIRLWQKSAAANWILQFHRQRRMQQNHQLPPKQAPSI